MNEVFSKDACHLTFKSSSMGLTKSPRPRKSFNHPSTLSWTLDEAEFSSRDGLNSTWDPVSSKRIVNTGSTSESCNTRQMEIVSVLILMMLHGTIRNDDL